MAKPKGSPKTGGRQKGVPNKTTAILKDAILTAAELAGGGKDGLVNYLKTQASANPGPFMALLGKVLPMQIAGDEDNPLRLVTRIELVAPNDNAKDRAAP